MKRVAILQSNYIPWKGYFDIIASVDEFILYDWNGIMKNAFRNEKRFGLHASDFEDFKSGKFDDFFNYMYNASEFSRNDDLRIMHVNIFRKSGVKLIDTIKLEINPKYELQLKAGFLFN